MVLPDSTAIAMEELRQEWDAAERARVVRIWESHREAVLRKPFWGHMDGDLVLRTPEDARWGLVSQLHFFFKLTSPQHRFYRMIHSMTSVCVPVALLAILAIVYVNVILLRAEEEDRLVIRELLVYDQPAGDPVGAMIGGSLLNALLVLAAAVGFTGLFISLFAAKQYKLLLKVLGASLGLLFCGPWCYFAFQFVRLYDVPTDTISFVLLCANFSAAGLFALLWVGPQQPTHWLHRSSLVLLGLAVAWPFLEFPEMSVWMTLVILGVYDLVAVLSPCGPLKYFADNEIEGLEGFDKSKLPGLMYTGRFFSLGMGDLIFYTVLMGRAARFGWVTAICVVVCVVMGVFLTTIWAYASTANALPALPISLALGLIFYGMGPAVLDPFVEILTPQGLFI